MKWIGISVALVITCCLLAVVLLGDADAVRDGAGETAPAGGEQRAEVNHQAFSAQVEVDAHTFDVEAAEGILRVYLLEDDARFLIRSRPVGADRLTEESARTLAAREVESIDAWGACLARFADGAPESYTDEYDAWLEVVEQLDEQYAKDPGHVGILRDLVAACTRLLAFEGKTGFGSNLCLLASERLTELTQMAAPLDPADRELVSRLDARLRFHMHQYPPAAGGGDPDIRSVLTALGQAEFYELQSFTVGPLTAQPYRTLGGSPDPDLLWDELHFLLSKGADAPPDGTVAYTLTRRGDPEQGRWYLLMHVLNRSTLVTMYGATRPDYPAVRERIRRHALAALATARGMASQETGGTP